MPAAAKDPNQHGECLILHDNDTFCSIPLHQGPRLYEEETSLLLEVAAAQAQMLQFLILAEHLHETEKLQPRQVASNRQSSSSPSRVGTLEKFNLAGASYSLCLHPLRMTGAPWLVPFVSNLFQLEKARLNFVLY